MSPLPGTATGWSAWRGCSRTAFCNAYLLDVWTMLAYRRQGIGTTMVRHLMSRVPGQHIGLQTEDAEAFYASLGYHHQPVFMSAVAGEWLANEANARLRAG